jgi:hypothetical protein
MRGKYRFHRASVKYKHTVWISRIGLVHTLGSTMPGVCTRTTCCRNLTQQMRTPGVALSIRRKMLDLIDDMSCQSWASLGFETLGHIQV